MSLDQSPWPDELTPELLDILGRPCFMFIKLAQLYRAAGHAIPNRAEDEQAFFLHLYLKAWFKYGDDGWRAAVTGEFSEMHAIATAKQAKG